MSAGFMSTGPCATLTAKRRCSSGRTAVEFEHGRPRDPMGPGLADRSGVFGYMTNVLERQLDRLAGGIEAPARYFYELSIRHEDMHVEALAYMRQTLGYSRPEGLGDPHPPDPAPGPAMPMCRAGAGGSARLPPTASSSTTRNGRTMSTLRRFGSPRLRSPMPSSPLSSRPAAIAGGNSGARKAGPGASARAPKPVYWLANEAATGPGAATARSSRSLRTQR